MRHGRGGNSFIGPVSCLIHADGDSGHAEFALPRLPTPAG